MEIIRGSGENEPHIHHSETETKLIKHEMYSLIQQTCHYQ